MNNVVENDVNDSSYVSYVCDVELENIDVVNMHVKTSTDSVSTDNTLAGTSLKRKMSRRSKAICQASNKEFFNLNAVKVVSSKVSKCYSKWKEELAGDQDESYLLNGIHDGFDILEGHSPMFNACMSNYKSASIENRLKVVVVVGAARAV